MPKHEEKKKSQIMIRIKGTQRKKKIQKQKHETLTTLQTVYCTYLSFVLIQYF